jgi:hypothetical protein
MNIPLAVTLYQVSVAAHVAAAIIAFGPTFAFPVIQMTAEKAYPRALPFAWRALKKISHGMVYPLAVVVGLTGAYQWSDGHWSIGHGDNQWLAIGAGLYVLAFITSLIVFLPMDSKAIAAADQMVADAGPDGEVTLSEEYLRITKPAAIVGPILSLTVLVIVFLMETKPF